MDVVYPNDVRILFCMEQSRSTFGQDLKTSWFLPLRLAIFLIVVGVIVVSQRSQNEIFASFLVYSLLTLILLITIAVRIFNKYPNFSRPLILLQILSEVVVISTVIQMTGNITSPFTTLFLLTIVSAALAYQLLGTLFIASSVTIAFATVIWFSSGEIFPGSLDISVLQTIYSANDDLFYTAFIYICMFYLVAFVAGYLSQKIRSKERELKAASESLARVKLETDEILKHLQSGLITIDHFGRIIYFNEAAEKITGFREYQIKSKNCLEVFAKRMPELSEKILAGLKSSQDEQRCEVNITNIDGQTVPLGISTSVLIDDIKGVRGVIGIFQNLTEAKKLEEKMRRADRLAAVGELSASIAHEIRNPLASISGSVEILSKELNLEGENHQLMNLIVKEASRLSNILTDFLVYARVKQPSFGKVEINRLIRDIISIANQHPACRPNTRLHLESDDTTIYVSGDEEQLKQILLNLLVNAMDALSVEGGEVNVSIESNIRKYPDIINICVHDDGCGLSERVKQNIFTPFFSTKKEGTGLGLAIVRRLVENMGGKIWVESSTQQGTTFIFTLIKHFKGMPLSKPIAASDPQMLDYDQNQLYSIYK